MAVSGHKNLKKLEAIIKEFSPDVVCLSTENRDFTGMFPEVYFVFDEKGLIDAASLPDADTVVIGTAGISGLAPAISAIKSGKRILSANKESIVAAGPLLARAMSEKKNFIIPLDSEHNAIFNIYNRIEKNFIKNIYLTASGGPLLNREITARTGKSDVMKHPVWEMGPSITVNSATLINKGFEVIEAHFLFNMDYGSIKVLIHPQSLIHGIVETIDGTNFLAASPSDMRYPIALGLFYPLIPEQKFPSLNLSGKNLEFFEPDFKKFPLLKLSYDAGKEGGIVPAVLNASNDTAASAFLDGRISFVDIPVIVKKVLDIYMKRNLKDKELDMEIILNADMEARKAAELLIGKHF
jgi:1-deoxy-D-xylulose-5-phosphate reductoisomerase